MMVPVQAKPISGYQENLPLIQQRFVLLPEFWGSIKTKYLAKYLWKHWENIESSDGSHHALRIRTLFFFYSKRCTRLLAKPKWAERCEKILQKADLYFYHKQSDLNIFERAVKSRNIPFLKQFISHIPESTEGLNPKDKIFVELERHGAIAVESLMLDLREQYTESEALSLLWESGSILGNLDVITRLKGRGFDHNHLDPKKRNLLHLASLYGHSHVVEYCLREKLYDIDSKDTDGRTALHLSCRKGHLTITQLLFQAGSNVKVKDNEGNSIFHQACYSGRAKMVKYILGNQIDDISSRTNSGRTGADIACTRRHVKLLGYLIDSCGVDKNYFNHLGRGFLHTAICSDSLDMVKFLVNEKGLSPNQKDAANLTPLLIICARLTQNFSPLSSMEIVKFLLSCDGIDILSATPSKLTCLGMALTILPLNRRQVQLRQQRGVHDELKKFEDMLSKTEQVAATICEFITQQAEHLFNAINQAKIDHLIVFSYFRSIAHLHDVLSLFQFISSKGGDLNFPPFNTYYQNSLRLGNQLLSALAFSQVLSGLKEAFGLILRGFNEELDKDDVSSFLLSKISELQKNLGVFKAFCSLGSFKSFHEPLIDMFSGYEESLRKLRERCQSKMMAKRDPNREYDEADVFSLLSQEFGIGLAQDENQLNTEESFFASLGVIPKTLYACGLLEGRDLRVLGINPRLRLLVTNLLENLHSQRLANAANDLRQVVQDLIGQIKKLPDSLQNKIRPLCIEMEKLTTEFELKAEGATNVVNPLLKKIQELDANIKLTLLREYLLKSNVIPPILRRLNSAENPQISAIGPNTEMNLSMADFYQLEKITLEDSRKRKHLLE